MNMSMLNYPDAAQIAQVKAELSSNTGLFIDGAYVPSQTGQTMPVENPATGAIMAHAACAQEADIDKAVRAARRAFDEGPWRTMPATERSRILHRFAELIEAAGDELALIESLDNGMPYRFARMAAVAMGVEALRYYAGWPGKLGGDTLPVAAPGEWFGYTLRQPVGVVAAISAWNFPLSMACGKMAPALAAGCTIVLKPAEQAPLAALRLGRLAQEAGIPDGVLNIVPGFGKDAGQALVEHPLVDKISFTGSTSTGKSVLATAAKHLKQVTLELGGKSPTLIFQDADLQRAIEGAAMGVFINSGQVCVARSRLFVHEKVYDEVVAGISAMIPRLKVGDPFAADTILGPLISQVQFDKVRRYIALGTQEGGTLSGGGQRIGECGYFIAPTLLTDVPLDATVMREEIFGPVISAVRFRDDDIETIARLANDTPYGLAASIWTRDLSTAHRLASRIDAGMIDVNGSPSMQFGFPFGGFKQSGLGRENGREGIEAFMQVKSILMRL